jgi:uncharacterized protein with NAD-binding domain and iron-sulfur cluster
MTEPASRAGDGATRVAILGGGCGGLAAAWELTASPALRRRFEVTVYEESWRLGGKGASGRVGGGDRGPGSRRIHEHGLHVWFGFYERSFRMLRAAYEEAGLARGDDWWTVPFQKCDGISLYEQRDDGTWLRQPVGLPRRGGPDRGPPTASRRLGVGLAVARTTRLLATGLRAELRISGPRRGTSWAEAGDPTVVDVAATLDHIADQIDAMESPVMVGDDDAGPSATRGHGQVATGRRGPMSAPAVEQLIAVLWQHVRRLGDQLRAQEASDRVRLWRGVLELVAASLAGIVDDGILWRGFDVLDAEDLRDWLGRHGADHETLTRSPVLRGLYDLTFAYRGGDKRRPSLAAGRGLQSLLLMINYEGSFMWRMRAGMGDVVFSPLYLALRERGVRFRFFSQVTRLRLMPGRAVVDAIELTRRATIAAGPDRYEPIERIGDWWCWPAAPYRAQLIDREPHAETLVRGADFDDVVLAIPVGALSEICGELAAADGRFSVMLNRAETVRTKGLQLWLTKTVDELRGPPSVDGLDSPATAFAEPFDTYCDMSHLLAAENYERDDGPKGVAYFCAVLPDAVDAAAVDEAVRQCAGDYLEREVGAIWPGAVKDGAFDWSVLFDPSDRAGRDRLRAQHISANVTRTDRYVTTPAGSVDARLHSGRSGFENLVLAGDWTRNGIDGGCVEAAVVSGAHAAAALIAVSAGATATRRHHPSYVEYGSLATAPGPLLCERARLYCFLLQTDRHRVQQLCDRVLRQPTGGVRRYLVPRLSPVILTFGTIAGLRSLHPAHADRASASEPEAAIWVPTIAQHYDGRRYVDEHLAIFMPYLWVDDPIALASGREVYGFAKTQGWMPRLGDPRGHEDERPPEPPESLAVDVHGVREYSASAEMGRRRLITIRRRGLRRGGPADAQPGTPIEGDRAPIEGDRAPIEGDRAPIEGDTLSSLAGHFLKELGATPGPSPAETARRSGAAVRSPLQAAKARTATLAELMSEQVVRHVFLKQIRDAEHGDLAVVQQVIEARSRVLPGSLRWRRLRGSYELSVERLASHPLEDELGLAGQQTVRLAFAAEFGFRMESGVVRWPGG